MYLVHAIFFRFFVDGPKSASSEAAAAYLKLKLRPAKTWRVIEVDIRIESAAVDPGKGDLWVALNFTQLELLTFY